MDLTEDDIFQMYVTNKCKVHKTHYYLVNADGHVMYVDKTQ